MTTHSDDPLAEQVGILGKLAARTRDIHRVKRLRKWCVDNHVPFPRIPWHDGTQDYAAFYRNKGPGNANPADDWKFELAKQLDGDLWQESFGHSTLGDVLDHVLDLRGSIVAHQNVEPQWGRSVSPIGGAIELLEEFQREVTSVELLGDGKPGPGQAPLVVCRGRHLARS